MRKARWGTALCNACCCTYGSDGARGPGASRNNGGTWPGHGLVVCAEAVRRWQPAAAFVSHRSFTRQLGGRESPINHSNESCHESGLWLDTISILAEAICHATFLQHCGSVASLISKMSSVQFSRRCRPILLTIPATEHIRKTGTIDVI